jgi:Chlorophyll A-B binding protein
MNFGGPAPELVNGRLAMLAFLAGISAEIASHETIYQQFADAPVPILAAAAVIIVASIVPIVRGSAVLDDGAGEGLKIGSFNVTNELINGRAAMLGLAILGMYEAVRHVPLF